MYINSWGTQTGFETGALFGFNEREKMLFSMSEKVEQVIFLGFSKGERTFETLWGVKTCKNPDFCKIKELEPNFRR